MKNLTLALFLALGATAFAEEDQHAKPAPARTPAPLPSIRVPIETQILVGVETLRIAQESLPRSIEVFGRTTLRNDFEAVITTPIEGRLIATDDYKSPAVGDRVAKGQILAIVDQALSAASLIQLSGERARVQSDIKQTMADVEYYRKELARLTSSTAVSAKDVELARTQLAISSEKLGGLKRQLETLEESTTQLPVTLRDQYQRIVLRSPIDGVVSRSHATIGEYVRPEKELYQVVNTSELYVQAEVFEADLGIALEAARAIVVLDATPGVAYPAASVSRGTEIDPATRTLHMLFSLPNPTGRLVAGMVGKVQIATNETVTGLRVPRAAAFLNEGQQTVITKTAPESFALVPVAVRAVTGNDLLVEPLQPGALKAGDRVVVQGIYQIRMSR